MDEPLQARGPSEPPSSDDERDDLPRWLDKLERLCQAATPGPWELDGLIVRNARHQSRVCDVDTGSYYQDRADALFIAAARHALPKLLATVCELQAELDRADKRLRWATTKDDSERRELERELFGGEHG